MQCWSVCAPCLCAANISEACLGNQPSGECSGQAPRDPNKHLSTDPRQDISRMCLGTQMHPPRAILAGCLESSLLQILYEHVSGPGRSFVKPFWEGASEAKHTCRMIFWERASEPKRTLMKVFRSCASESTHTYVHMYIPIDMGICLFIHILWFSFWPHFCHT